MHCWHRHPSFVHGYVLPARRRRRPVRWSASRQGGGGALAEACRPAFAAHDHPGAVNDVLEICLDELLGPGRGLSSTGPAPHAGRKSVTPPPAAPSGRRVCGPHATRTPLGGEEWGRGRGRGPPHLPQSTGVYRFLRSELIDDDTSSGCARTRHRTQHTTCHADARVPACRVPRAGGGDSSAAMRTMMPACARAVAVAFYTPI